MKKLILIGILLASSTYAQADRAGNGGFYLPKDDKGNSISIKLGHEHPGAPQLYEYIHRLRLPEKLKEVILIDLSHIEIYYTSEIVSLGDISSADFSRNNIFPYKFKIDKDTLLAAYSVCTDHHQAVVYFEKTLERLSPIDQISLVLHESIHRLGIWFDELSHDERFVMGFEEILKEDLKGTYSDQDMQTIYESLFKRFRLKAYKILPLGINDKHLWDSLFSGTAEEDITLVPSSILELSNTVEMKDGAGFVVNYGVNIVSQDSVRDYFNPTHKPTSESGYDGAVSVLLSIDSFLLGYSDTWSVPTLKIQVVPQKERVLSIVKEAIKKAVLGWKFKEKDLLTSYEGGGFLGFGKRKIEVTDENIRNDFINNLLPRIDILFYKGFWNFLLDGKNQSFYTIFQTFLTETFKKYQKNNNPEAMQSFIGENDGSSHYAICQLIYLVETTIRSDILEDLSSFSKELLSRDSIQLKVHYEFIQKLEKGNFSSDDRDQRSIFPIRKLYQIEIWAQEEN